MSLRILLFVAFVPCVLSTSLNCTFKEPCCWSSRHGVTPWRVTNSQNDSIDYRRLFRTEKYKFLPKGSFLSLTVTPNDAKSAEWTSCPICSRSSVIVVRTRAWQSPTARLVLCWRFVEEVHSVRCAPIKRFSPSGYTISRFAVPSQHNLQLFFKMASKGSQTHATSVIDKIIVDYEPCLRRGVRQHPTSLPVQVTPTMSSPFSPPPVAQPTPVTSTAKPLSSSSKPSPVVNPALAANPLNAIFGEEFAAFLIDDTDGAKTVVKDRNVMPVDQKQRITNQKQGITNMAATRPQPSRPTFVPQTRHQLKPQPRQLQRSGNLMDQLDDLLHLRLFSCNTMGGCLFDRSMCSYYNSELSNGAAFQMTSVLDQNFVQASVAPGATAILETETSFSEPHTVYFDSLEFTEGGTLSACCYTPQKASQELFCPFISQIDSSPVLWRSSRINCPQGTTKLMFICENYGRQVGSCSIDNVRLHRMSDILQLEPCQKDILRTN